MLQPVYQRRVALQDKRLKLIYILEDYSSKTDIELEGPAWWPAHAHGPQGW